MIFTAGRGVDLLYLCYPIWARIWAFLNGVKLIIRGKENLQNNQSYIFVINHGSTADIVIAAAAMTYRYRPLGKKELMEIPLMGYMFKKSVVLVDRSDAESRKKSLERMKNLIHQNISVLIAPEGTRNRTKEPLQPFKEGAFRLAIECQLPIVPVMLLNTRTLYPNDSWLMNHCPLKCHFLKPISTEGLTEADILMLKEKVFRLMERYYVEHDIQYSNKSQPH